MMKRLLAMILLLGLLLTACGSPEPTEPPTQPPMTAERLVQEMIAATADNPMTSSTAQMQMDITIAGQGMNMEMNTDMTMVTMASPEPYTAYSEMVISMNMLGEQVNQTTRQYMTEQDGAIVSYVHGEEENTWNKVELDLDTDKLMQESQNYNYLTQEAGTLQLAETTQMYNEREVYVLRIDLQGQQIQEALASLDSLWELLEDTGVDFDFSALTMPTVYYVDAETYLPVGMEIDIQGMGEMMTGMLGSMIGSLPEGMEIDIPTFKMTYTEMGYGPVEIPVVPDEGRMKAEQASFNPDQGDGTYIIQETGSAVKVTLPAGWSVTALDYDYLEMKRDDSTRYISYEMWTGIAGGQSFVSKIERGDIADLMTSGSYASHCNTTVELNGNTYGGVWITCNNGAQIFYVWDQIGAEGNYVLISVVDGSNSTMYDAVADALTYIEEYQFNA